MKWLIGIISFTGFNFTFWALMGVVRMVTEKIQQVQASRRRPRQLNWLSMALVTSAGLVGSVLTVRLLLATESSAAVTWFAPTLTWLYLAILVLSVLTGYLHTHLETKTPQRTSLLMIVPYVLTLAGLTTLVILTQDGFTRSFLALTSVAVAVVGVMAGMIMAELAADRQSARQRPTGADVPPHRVTPADVAVVIAAHNEEVTIADTIQALQKSLPPQNIFVGSDASTDRTVEIVRALGISVLDLHPNRGKAKTLVAVLSHFSITDHFKAVMIVDADIVMSQDRMQKLLPLFDDPRVSVTVGRAVPKWFNHRRPRWHMFVTAYRIRLWRSLQFGLRLGQTWKPMNVTPIIPGGSSIYRSSVLRQLHIDAPGLEIEDFNMTFEVHHKRLGKVVYNPAATIIDQEPYNLRDFIRQVRRWYVGFWQTVWRHGVWPSWFWFTMAAFTLEMFLFAVFLSLLPVVFVMLAVNSFAPIQFPALMTGLPQLAELSVSDILVGIFLVDYVITVIIALGEKKPVILLYGLGFVFLRYLDALMFVIALPISLLKRSHGQWIPPQRQAYTLPNKTTPTAGAPST
ncbi:MAG: glycosyltransferase family 2 protein [Candidatus Kerfeldbacteria bacterium]|nr:glycosyltransferase family 2 protein [Candidatus Kerfeldbacteria bacterium]